jgi:hypothetical protein
MFDVITAAGTVVVSAFKTVMQRASMQQQQQ